MSDIQNLSDAIIQCIDLALNSDTREQSIAYREEAIRTIETLQGQCDQLRAENNHLRMENGLAEFHKLKDQNAELLSRFSKLAELLGDPIGGEYCALEKAISELMREKAEAIGELAVCEEHAQTMERDYEATIAENKREIAALQSQLSRICKEGFNNDDTIGGEPADDYVIRKVAKMASEICLLTDLLRQLREETLYPPQPNCSCFISAPCSDCTRHGPMRELLDSIDRELKP